LFNDKRIAVACWFSNTTHATCHYRHDWQGTHACLSQLWPRALRQVRYACATKRHFLWGAGRSRAELELFELLANTLAEALRVPQTKRFVEEEAAQRDGETFVCCPDVCHAAMHSCRRPTQMRTHCMSAVKGTLGVRMRLPCVDYRRDTSMPSLTRKYRIVRPDDKLVDCTAQSLPVGLHRRATGESLARFLRNPDRGSRYTFCGGTKPYLGTYQIGPHPSLNIITTCKSDVTVAAHD
jgi:hypothetical protein